MSPEQGNTVVCQVAALAGAPVWTEAQPCVSVAIVTPSGRQETSREKSTRAQPGKVNARGTGKATQATVTVETT